jgi:RNA polymerase sigma-70 factor (ECF subfamily)
MEHKELKKLTEEERRFADEHYNLIMEFLRKERLDSEEFFDVVVFEYLLSVQIYLNDTELQSRCNFAACSYMHMKRAVYEYFREQKAQKRCNEAGADISMEELELYIGDVEDDSSTIYDGIIYDETIKEIDAILTDEQKKIFYGKLKGYSLKEIVQISGINTSIYKKFAKIRNIVAGVMEI